MFTIIFQKNSFHILSLQNVLCHIICKHLINVCVFCLLCLTDELIYMCVCVASALATPRKLIWFCLPHLVSGYGIHVYAFTEPTRYKRYAHTPQFTDCLNCFPQWLYKLLLIARGQGWDNAEANRNIFVYKGCSINIIGRRCIPIYSVIITVRYRYACTRWWAWKPSIVKPQQHSWRLTDGHNIPCNTTLTDSPPGFILASIFLRWGKCDSYYI